MVAPRLAAEKNAALADPYQTYVIERHNGTLKGASEACFNQSHQLIYGTGILIYVRGSSLAL